MVTPANNIITLSNLERLHMYSFFFIFLLSSSSITSPAIAQNPPIGNNLMEYSVGSFLFFLLNE